MTKTLCLTAGLVLAASAGMGWSVAVEATNPMPPTGVRSSSPVLATLIAWATEQSATFRGLIEAINASDGIVYVEAGQCGHHLRSCLTRVTAAGRFRMLWIKVDPLKTDVELVASIGHELQHAVEILSDSDVRSNAEMLLYYLRTGRKETGASLVFETTAAIDAGTAVRAEIRKAPPRLKTD